MENVIVRHGPPGKIDEAAHGTKCKVDLGDGSFDIYVQLESVEELEPRWMHLGNFNDESYNSFMNIKTH